MLVGGVRLAVWGVVLVVCVCVGVGGVVTVCVCLLPVDLFVFTVHRHYGEEGHQAVPADERDRLPEDPRGGGDQPGEESEQ